MEWEDGFEMWIMFRNELIRGETGWSTFEEREAKVMVEWMLRVVFEDNLMSEDRQSMMIETGCKSIWWAKCRNVLGLG